ncbi:MAG: hypothetical protein AAB857_04245, partial [Patescibacteria group bacterium]
RVLGRWSRLERPRGSRRLPTSVGRRVRGPVSQVGWDLGFLEPLVLGPCVLRTGHFILLNFC